jgi:hypothetical protein
MKRGAVVFPLSEQCKVVCYSPSDTSLHIQARPSIAGCRCIGGPIMDAGKKYPQSHSSIGFYGTHLLPNDNIDRRPIGDA